MNPSLELPDLPELMSGLRVVTLPLNVSFRGVNEREVALFQGPEGWGEFSPFLEYGSEEASSWLEAALESAWQKPVPTVRETVQVNATLPAVRPDQVEAVLRRYDNFGTLKVKVAEIGQRLDDDVARLERVRELFPDAQLRIDANGGWSLVQAAQALNRLRDFNLEYVEQPCTTVEELAELRAEGHGVRIAADESIRKTQDPYRVAELEAADLMIVKVQPLGGIRRVLQLVEELPLEPVVSSALESSVGISQGLALAAALPEQRYAAGLGTASLFSADITRHPLVMHDGSIRVRTVEPDPTLLELYQVSSERKNWWIERIAACYGVLQAR